MDLLNHTKRDSRIEYLQINTKQFTDLNGKSGSVINNTTFSVKHTEFIAYLQENMAGFQLDTLKKAQEVVDFILAVEETKNIDSANKKQYLWMEEAKQLDTATANMDSGITTGSNEYTFLYDYTTTETVFTTFVNDLIRS